MDNLSLFKNKIKYLILTITFFAFIFGAVFALNLKTASADNSAKISAKELLPLSSIEHKALSSPLDVYFDDEVTAILSDDNVSKSFAVYLSGEYVVNPLTSITSLKKFDRLLDNFVLFDNNILYLLPITDFTEDSTPTPLLCGNKNIGCDNFDVTGNRLSIVSGNKILVYTIENSNATQLNTSEITITNGDTPIASNSFGLYYVENGWLIFRAYDDIYNPVPVCELNTNVILANDSFVYYTVGNVIHQIDLAQKTDVPLTFKPVTDDEFDLGMPKNISNLSFKGNNLLITDTGDNSIQEFKIENAELTFTGFAIADGKTAYNRVSKNTKKIENYADKVAVLDQNKITIVNALLGNYSTENFINFTLGETAITDICLGKDVLLGVSGKQIYAYNLNSKTSVGSILTTEFTIEDVAYRNGYFYVLSHDENDAKASYISEISESDLIVKSSIEIAGYSFDAIELDLLGNVYFTDAENLYSVSNFDVKTIKTLASLSSFTVKPSKVVTDLAGKIYAVSNGELYVLSGNAFSKFNLDVYVKDFALSFDRSAVYFIDGNAEKVYFTENLNNSNVQSLSIPNDYTLSASTTSLDALKGVTVRENASVFGYNGNNGDIEFNGLLQVESEYLLISEVLDPNSTSKFLLLVGSKQTVMVNALDVTFTEVPTQKDVASVVYVTTPVHAYYLPKITITNDYVAKVNGEHVFVPLSSAIYPYATTTFNDTEFYFAKIVIGESEHDLYIPKSFTALEIASSIENKTFTVAKIKPTTIYLDAELKNSLTTTTENSTIRLFKVENGIIEIEFYNGQNWVKGYALEKDLLDEPNTAIRNILIVLAVITCACGSITFFILRGKHKE